jgi:hypothetical protein
MHCINAASVIIKVIVVTIRIFMMGRTDVDWGYNEFTEACGGLSHCAMGTPRPSAGEKEMCEEELQVGSSFLFILLPHF